MIVDTLANRGHYRVLGPRIQAALDYLAATDFSQLAPGSYELDGKKLFAIINDYHTKPRETEPFEVHRRYLDVQYVVSGEEEFGYLPLGAQTPNRPYHEAHDYAEFDYQSNSQAAAFIPLKAGMFAIFFPGDMHMPGTLAKAVAVRKVVVKVLLD